MKLPNDRINVIQEILDKTEKEIENMNPVNILIAGKTGVGKSTLINNIFREKLADTGIGKPVTKHLRKISKNGIPIVLYDTRGLELEQTIQQRVKKEMLDLINQNKHSKEAIHVVYYCIQATSSRIEDMELELIKDISENIPVILVLTQALGQPTEDFKRYLENMNLPVAGIQTVMSEPYVISDDYTIPAFGLKELVSKSLEVIPEDAQKAFTNAQQADIERKAKNARRWATRYVASSFGIGFIPIPFSDASVLVPMQITLLAHITAIFGISLDKSSIVSIIAAVGGTGSATFLGKSIVGNALKFIPGAGTVIGGVISGTTASIVTSALAASYIEVLSVMAFKEMNGETVNLSFIENLMRKQFKKNIHMKGKKINKKELEFDRTTDTTDYEHLLNNDENQKVPFYKKVAPKIKNTVKRFSRNK
ncbi:YcjF family protein [Marinilactibacillus sp. Marseille-P9653]|uniref:YcjF family protein n=1 Tax=Marinilactibacillus sp. Marseille-P9653 TaxID=2866583 RepID=UPI001CE47D27|nr:GTPase [Marinilactibacillus sp. Marseille-P9653]